MYRIIFMMIICLSASRALGQYTVTKVNGEVINKTTGEKIRTGSKLTDQDILVFSSADDLIRVIVAGKGIYVISPSPKAQKSSNVLVEMLKSALHIKSKEGYLSGRSPMIERIPEAFETEPTVNQQQLFIGENLFLFDPRKYPAEEGNRFFIQIEQSGKSPEIHGLQIRSDTLIIPSAAFNPLGRDPHFRTKYTLGFYRKQSGSSESLAELTPYIDESGEAEQIIRTIIASAGIKDRKKREMACYEEVYSALGKPSALAFTRIFQKLDAEHAMTHH